MIKNFIKMAIRNMVSGKSYFFINLIGLSGGIIAFVLIALWIKSETNFDKFHQGAENIYRVDYKLFEEGKLETHSAGGAPAVGKEMKNAFPEVLDYTRFRRNEAVVSYGETFFKETDMFYAQSSFFNVFSFPLIEGKTDSTLLAINKAVISESAAKRYFGNESPIGKIIKINGTDAYEVSGIAKNPPSNSHLKFEILLSYENLVNRNQYFDNGWLGTSVYSYVRLSPGTDVQALVKKMPGLPEKFIGDFMKSAFFLVEFNLQKVTDIHLHSSLNNELLVNGSYRSIWFLAIIALLVLAIAFVNYMNLSTSRSIERAGEVGVRKVMGAQKSHLVFQFLTESGLLNLLAILVSFIVTAILIPVFGNLMQSPFQPKILDMALLFAGLFITGTLLTGFLPALYILRFSPALILKGKGQTGSRMMSSIKNGLVIFQFSISVILIAGTITINRQLNFVQQHDLGINIDEVLVIEGPQAINRETYQNNLEAFKNALLKQPQVENISVSTSVPGKEITRSLVFGIPVSGVNTEKTIDVIGIDNRFVDTYGLKLLAGRGFDKPVQNQLNQLILNESALSYFGFENPQQAVGKRLTSGNEEAFIIGVVKDFNQKSLKELPKPIAFSNLPFNQYYSLKINPKNIKQLIPAIEASWNTFFPSNPINYFFLNNSFNNQYKSDQHFAKLFMSFSVLAIFIACLGLLGLSSYSTALRTKEIGVRKINGAKISEILTLLNRDFVKWVAIAFVIATPIAYYAMHKWLENFAYKTELSWWIFALAGLLALGISLLTVSWQSWKAATRNPVEALRYE
ncbi:MAG TPA: ABC transporter permease [Prolixibacteraceae bacterium]|nr:ABC transporter permease [Prolixibacteraceae bacterium]